MVKIESSKTDQYQNGASLVIARTGQVTCPVGMMERYFRMGEVDHSSQAKLFQGIVQTKCGERLRKNGGLSYTRVRELLLEKLYELGFDPALFGMHGLWAGGYMCHGSSQHLLYLPCIQHIKTHVHTSFQPMFSNLLLFE